jgi:hypothetical protein
LDASRRYGATFSEATWEAEVRRSLGRSDADLDAEATAQAAEAAEAEAAQANLVVAVAAAAEAREREVHQPWTTAPPRPFDHDRSRPEHALEATSLKC